MNETELAKRPPATVSPAAMTRLDSQVIAPARLAGYELPIIGTTEEPDSDVYWQAPTGHWWLFSDHRSDPTAERYGGVVVPDEVRERLTRLLREGFAPDIIVVGHELPASYSPGEPIPELVRAGRRELALPPRPALSRATSATALRIGRASLQAMKTLVVGASALGAVIGFAVTRLDPIVVAGIRDPQTRAVTWVEVARWDW